MVNHSVVYVVVVEVQESVAASAAVSAAAFTAPTLWTAATAPPFPLAVEVLLAGAGVVAGSGVTVIVVAASEGRAAALLAWSPDPSGNEPLVLLAFQLFQVLPVG
jgi:hypothetical protein